MPEVPQVKTCCFCCSTEVGSKIIGWWLLISGILSVISWIVVLIGTLGRNQPKDESEEDYCFYSDNDLCIIGSTTNAIVEVVFAVFVVLMGVYLLLGVYKRNWRLLKTWLTLATVYLVILAVGTVLLLIQGHFDVLAQIINFLLTAYFIVVVYSFYRENSGSAPQVY